MKTFKAPAIFFSSLLLLSLSQSAWAAVVGESVMYRHGQTELEGFLAYEDSSEEPRPGILVVHEWKGLGENARNRALELAALGYTAFAVDMYGKGVRPQTHEEAAKEAGIYKNDRKLMRDRILAGLNVLSAHPLVQKNKIGAIGYCFGGTTALELARSGADVKGVVSFHGALSNPNPADASNIKAKILVCHGADDPYVPAEEVETFKKEMDAVGAPYSFESYPGAVHSFTIREAGDDVKAGAAYNEEADKKSWESMKRFFEEVFR